MKVLEGFHHAMKSKSEPINLILFYFILRFENYWRVF